MTRGNAKKEKFVCPAGVVAWAERNAVAAANNYLFGRWPDAGGLAAVTAGWPQKKEDMCATKPEKEKCCFPAGEPKEQPASTPRPLNYLFPKICRAKIGRAGNK